MQEVPIIDENVIIAGCNLRFWVIRGGDNDLNSCNAEEYNYSISWKGRRQEQ